MWLKIQCEYNPLFNTCTFSSTDIGLNYFTFYGHSPMMKVLGFEINNGDVESSFHINPSLTSTRQIDLSGNNSFYFTTNLQTDNVLFFNTVSISNHVPTVTKQQTQGAKILDSHGYSFRNICRHCFLFNQLLYG